METENENPLLRLLCVQCREDLKKAIKGSGCLVKMWEDDSTRVIYLFAALMYEALDELDEENESCGK